jgi:uncharacterized UPF0160 family protein
MQSIQYSLTIIWRSFVVQSLSRPNLKVYSTSNHSRSLRYISMSHINPSRGRDAAIFGSDSATKRQKLNGPLIGTHKQVNTSRFFFPRTAFANCSFHSGHFHADEALAVYLLRLLPTFSSSPLIRTRDPTDLAKCHTVVDVGGEHDPSRNRFDHHQRGFNVTFPGRNTKLSAAGLVYLHLGRAIIAQVTGLAEDKAETVVLHEQLYADLIEAFDANDNGIDVYDSSELEVAGIKPRFDNVGFSLASVVKRYNYDHDDESALSAEEKQVKEDERFERASAFVGSQFLMALTEMKEAWLPARAIVREAFAKRREVHPSGAIVVLPHRDGGLPWSDHLYAAEDDEGEKGTKVLYALFAESGAEDSKWRVRAVSVGRGSFKNRKDLPNAWKGIRDQQLSEVSGIPGCVFVHASGFIGGNLTYDGALQMAIKAVEI